MALEVSSVPLSETIIPGLPRRSMIANNSRATHLPEIEVPALKMEMSCSLPAR